MKPIINSIEKNAEADKLNQTCWTITYSDEETGEVGKLHFDIKNAIGESENITLLKEFIRYYIVNQEAKTDYTKVIDLLITIGKFTETAKISDLVEVIKGLK